MSGALSLALGMSGDTPLISVSPASALGEGSTLNITTNSVTVTSDPAASSVEWVKVSGGDVLANSPSDASTTFRGSMMAEGESRSAMFYPALTINGALYNGPNVPVSVYRSA